jgi:fructokinase
MADVIALGELLIDFVPTVSGVSLIEAPAFQKAPGGAPANVAVGLAKLGASAGFLGKVGDDAFGHFLTQTLSEHGVDISGVRFDPEARTALAFVSLRADGEREFMFYRHPSADMRYRPDEVDIEALRRAKIFHFGSISLIGEPSRSATLLAVQTARESGARISFDPNLRLNLWPTENEARQRVLETLPLAQVVKIAEEELRFLTGIAGLEAAARALWHPGLELLVVTLGAAGCRWFTAAGSGQAEGFQRTTGRHHRRRGRLRGRPAVRPAAQPGGSPAPRSTIRNLPLCQRCRRADHHSPRRHPRPAHLAGGQDVHGWHWSGLEGYKTTPGFPEIFFGSMRLVVTG